MKKAGKANTREAIAAFSEGINRKSPEAETNIKLLIERAKCQMTLGNFGYAVTDMDKALSYKQVPELYHYFT